MLAGLSLVLILLSPSAPARLGSWTGALGPQESESPALNDAATSTQAGAASAFVELTTQRSHWYVGESIPIAIRFGLDRELLEQRLIPLFRRPLDVQVQLRLPAFDALPGVRTTSRVTHNPTPATRFAVDDGVENGRRLDDRDRAGRPAAVFEIDRTLVATRAGTLTIPAPAVYFAYGSVFREDLLTGRIAADRQTALVPGEDVDIEVRELPDAGRPAAFTGAVGPLTVTATVDRAELAAGESLRLTLSFDGPGASLALEPPSLAELVEFQSYGRVTDPASGAFVYDLAPLGDWVQAVPPISVGYFDPEAEDYATASTVAIPLRVAPRAASRSESTGVDASPVTVGAAQPPSNSGATASKDPQLVWLWALAAVLIAIGVGFAVLRRGGRSGPQPGLRGDSTARHSIAAAQSAFDERVDQDPGAALADYLAVRLGVPAAAIIGPTAITHMQAGGIPIELARDIAQDLESWTAARFGGPPPPGGLAATRAYVARLDDTPIRAAEARTPGA